ncbi:MAG: PRC-barrel domain protein [Gemmatimonadales bacterium]|jgi:sporulation protein YlmC with PRC-barrel domain|nr:PRC-barrel domain protein [Gemmatimonadales bacterium]
MKKFALLASCAAAALLTPIGTARAQVAGGATLGVTVEEMRVVLLGWSARNKLLGADVYNDKGEKIGKIDDIIVSPERTVSHAIVGVGGFLGLIGKHEVAIPMDQIKFIGNRFVIPGASKAALKAMPEFHYAAQ